MMEADDMNPAREPSPEPRSAATTRLRLPYGTGDRVLHLPSDRLAAILRPMGSDAGDGSEGNGTDRVLAALAAPVGTPTLRSLAAGKSRIVLLTSDHTRPMPSRVTLPLLLNEIRAGAPDADVTVLVATGAHRSPSREELEERFGGLLAGRAHLAVHDCMDASGLADAGILPSGGPLRLNRTALEADLLIAEGFIEPHFFAGFSGGRKSVLPGIAAYETVLANHCAEFIAHPLARTGVLDGNPIHRDMTAAAARAKLAFILNVVLDSRRRIAAAFAGGFEAAHREGCAWTSRHAGVSPVMADIVVTTNGGYPLDRDIYQAVKSMTAAEAGCRPGGVIIAVSECRDGHGAEGFFRTFALGDPGVALAPSGRPAPADVYAAIRSRPADATLPDQWQSQILARILAGHRVILVSDAPAGVVESMGFLSAPDPDAALRLADRLLGSRSAPVTVIPDGVGVIVR